MSQAISPPGPGVPAAIVYRIDAEDRITFVNREWVDFARGNRGDAVMPEHMIGRRLWTCVADPTVFEIYSRLVAQARAGRTARFDYRCDAPARRRWFAMEIRPWEGGEVQFSSQLLREETRPSVMLLESGRSHDDRFVRVCSWCQRVAVPPDAWLPVEQAVAILHLLEDEKLPRLTHGICEPCADRMLAAPGWGDPAGQ